MHSKISKNEITIVQLFSGLEAQFHHGLHKRGDESTVEAFQHRQALKMLFRKEEYKFAEIFPHESPNLILNCNCDDNNPK